MPTRRLLVTEITRHSPQASVLVYCWQNNSLSCLNCISNISIVFCSVVIKRVLRSKLFSLRILIIIIIIFIYFKLCSTKDKPVMPSSIWTHKLARFQSIEIDPDCGIIFVFLCIRIIRNRTSDVRFVKKIKIARNCYVFIYCSYYYRFCELNKNTHVFIPEGVGKNISFLETSVYLQEWNTSLPIPRNRIPPVKSGFHQYVFWTPKSGRG